MDLRQLEYFLLVARRGSITAAAADLGIAQPTLTKSIRLLEQELSVTLFERHPRGVVLTDFGRTLLRHAESVHVQVQDAVREIEGRRGGAVGVVNIGAGPAWLRRHLPRAVARTLAKHPSIQVRIEGGFDDALLRSLRHGDLDFVVAELPAPDRTDDLQATPLTSDELGVCCRAGHPLVLEGGVRPGRLLDFPWVMPPRATRAQKRLRALFVASDLPPPEAAVETGSMAFLLQMLKDSDSLTFTVRTTLNVPDGSGLVMLDIPELAASRQAGVICRRGGWLSPAAAEILQELRAICAQDPYN
jgi:LysR family transcriptional regulator of gallate degradation